MSGRSPSAERLAFSEKAELFNWNYWSNCSLFSGRPIKLLNYKTKKEAFARHEKCFYLTEWGDPYFHALFYLVDVKSQFNAASFIGLLNHLKIAWPNKGSKNAQARINAFSTSVRGVDKSIGQPWRKASLARRIFTVVYACIKERRNFIESLKKAFLAYMGAEDIFVATAKDPVFTIESFLERSHPFFIWLADNNEIYSKLNSVLDRAFVYLEEKVEDEVLPWEDIQKLEVGADALESRKRRDREKREKATQTPQERRKSPRLKRKINEITRTNNAAVLQAPSSTDKEVCEPKRKRPKPNPKGQQKNKRAAAVAAPPVAVTTKRQVAIAAKKAAGRATITIKAAEQAAVRGLMDLGAENCAPQNSQERASAEFNMAGLLCGMALKGQCCFCAAGMVPYEDPLICSS